MQRSGSSSVPPLPCLLIPFVRVFRAMRRRLHETSSAWRTSLELGGAVLLVGAITAVAMLDVHPLLPLGGGLGLSVLFVAAHSWLVAQKQRAA